jgi:hypothetical protein
LTPGHVEKIFREKSLDGFCCLESRRAKRQRSLPVHFAN